MWIVAVGLQAASCKMQANTNREGSLSTSFSLSHSPPLTLIRQTRPARLRWCLIVVARSTACVICQISSAWRPICRPGGGGGERYGRPSEMGLSGRAEGIPHAITKCSLGACPAALNQASSGMAGAVAAVCGSSGLLWSSLCRGHGSWRRINPGSRLVVFTQTQMMIASRWRQRGLAGRKSKFSSVTDEEKTFLFSAASASAYSKPPGPIWAARRSALPLARPLSAAFYLLVRSRSIKSPGALVEVEVKVRPQESLTRQQPPISCYITERKFSEREKSDAIAAN